MSKIGDTPPILDACCGSKMFWFDKNHPAVLYQDCRRAEEVLQDGRRLTIDPDMIGDFRNMRFPDDTFYLVIFDPPHLIRAGEKSWLAKKYGRLDSNTWREDIGGGLRNVSESLSHTAR